MVLIFDAQDDDDDPLNSDDDADSDEGDEAVWETDNTIVCQFEKVKLVFLFFKAQIQL